MTGNSKFKIQNSKFDTPPVCDYEGSGYEQDFWQDQGRDYEDRVERIALRRLMPLSGKRVLEIGPGFGRLTGELKGYDHVVLMDYSRTMLAAARQHLGDEGYTYVAANVYTLPFASGSFDAATMIRVIHHIGDVPDALTSIRRVLAPDATFILEYANKRNLKAMLRYAFKRQAWSPYALEPIEFVELNFDFHPAYMQSALRNAGFLTSRRLPVSYFRLGALKRFVPMSLLVAMDRLLQGWGPLYSPSIFTLNRAAGNAPKAVGGPNAVDEPLQFQCPQCGTLLTADGDVLVCAKEGTRWAKRDGIYDFKEPLV